MRLPALVVVLALAWGVTGCSGEPEPYEDGSQGVPLAGLGPQVEKAGFEVVAPDAPLDAAPDAVVAALDDAGFDDSTTAPDATDEDDLPTVGSTAGLIALVGPGGADSGSALVLVFTNPSAAAVYAAADPEVLPDTVAADDRVKLLSGNLVAYASTEEDGDLAREALEALSGGASTASQ